MNINIQADRQTDRQTDNVIDIPVDQKQINGLTETQIRTQRNIDRQTGELTE